MNCSSPPGGSCTSTYKTALSFSSALTPAQVTECTNVFNSFSTGVGMYDPADCLIQAAGGPSAYFVGQTFPTYCCNFKQLYAFSGPVDAEPALNAGSFCSNPNFSTLSCVNRIDNRYVSGLQNVITCSNAGIIDALTASIPSTNNAPVWGQGLSLAQAFAVAGPYGCYDATPLQNAQLYSQTHQVCPNLDAGFSYSANLSTELTQASWSGLSLTAACCARQSQTNRTGDSGELCDAQACFQSPQCAEILRDYCNDVSNQRNVSCARWKSWTTSQIFTSPCTLTTSLFPSSGAFPSAMDQSMFSLLDYCAVNSVTDPDLCSALTFAPALGNHLLFPRVDAVHITDIVPQINSTNTVKTVTFSITNASNILFRSLTILTTNTNYTLTLQSATLFPSSSTLVTVSTGLSSFVEDAKDLYVVSNTLTWVGDSFNAADDCEIVGTFHPSLLTSSLSRPQNSDYPVALSCAAGDTEISYTFYDAGTTTTNLPPVFDTATCASLSAQHTATLGATAFPSCSCTSSFGCAGGLEGSCNSSTVISRQLSSVRVCSTQGWLTSPMFFADTFSWLPSPTTSQLRQDFPIFGGFTVGFVGNPYNYFLTPTLMVFPLTSGLFLG